KRLVLAIRSLLEHRVRAWSREREVLRRLAPLTRLGTPRRRMLSAQRALFRAVVHQSELRRANLARRVARLDSLSPLGVLARGYALVKKEPEGTLVRRAEEVAVGERVGIRLSEGEVSAVIDGKD
ncbi:exodeoxyribonuclease VII large subunit, partial [Myxococcota bacterium]|nr:exodeoxyribonuclease VII large subunit [Myxococcota bacterium]